MAKGSGPRMTLPTQLVLRAMIAEPTREVYGLEIGVLAELASGTIHPILARLERCGWLQSRWEDLDPHQLGRPRRRYYRLTPDGIVHAARALGRVRTPAALLGRIHPGSAAAGGAREPARGDGALHRRDGGTPTLGQGGPDETPRAQ
jgi:PadR family transcriptional regulator, regulatory protein PadR